MSCKRFEPGIHRRVSVIPTVSANHVSLGLVCLQIWRLQRAGFQSVSLMISADDLCIRIHYSLAFLVERCSNGWLLNLWNNLNICNLWNTGYGYVIVCFYLNILYIKACATIKILIKYFENLTHLNYICCPLHKYSSFLPGELLCADKITCSHFSTMPEGGIWVLLYGTKVSAIELAIIFLEFSYALDNSRLCKSTSWLLDK